MFFALEATSSQPRIGMDSKAAPRSESTDSSVVFEQGYVDNAENCDFRNTLEEQSQKSEPERVDEKPIESEESDGRGNDQAVSDSETAEISGDVEAEASAGNQQEISKAMCGLPALDKLVELSQGKLAAVPGDAAEAVMAVAENIAAKQPIGEQLPAANAAKATQTQVQTTAEVNNAVRQMNGQNQSQQTDQTADGSAKSQSMAEIVEKAFTNVGQNETVEQGQQLKASIATNENTAAQVSSQANTEVKQNPAEQVKPESDQSVEGVKVEVTAEVAKPGGEQTGGKETLSQQGDTNGAAMAVNAVNTANEKSVDFAQAMQGQGAGDASKTATAASEQIQASISSSVKQGENELTVLLNPPELGRVMIKLQQQDGQLSGLLEFSKPETKSEIQQLLPQLVRNLQDAGVAVKKLDVVQSQVDNSSYQQGRDYTGQGQGDNQQQFGENNTSLYGSGYDWVTSGSTYSDSDTYSNSYINDDAMNVLV